jgi:transcriptional regulator with XRE-family HTH domain
MRIIETQLSRSVEEWEARLGEQFRALRLSAGLDQAGLADAAGLSIGAIRNLERGRGSTARTIISVARSLGREDWLLGLSPAPSISPLDLVRAGPRERTRVYRPRGA